MNKANECTCPSGDGSLVHPCPAHPAVEQAGGDERAAFEAWWQSAEVLKCKRDVAIEAWQARAALAQPSQSQYEASFEEWLANELEGEDGQPVPAAVCDITLARRAFNHWPKLEQPAKVGSVRFSAGVSSRLVVEAAQRLYEFESTPEKEAERPEVVATMYTHHDDVDFREFVVVGNCDKGCEGFYGPEKLMTVAQHERIVGELRADRDSWAEQAEQRLADWDEMRKERDAALAKVERLRESKGDPSGSFDRCMKMMYERDENAKRLDAALARVAELEKGTVYVEARQCDECQHVGINDSADGLAACHDCDWTGPEPDEDKCPDCQRENCMAAACPQCGARYVLVASEEIAAPVAQAQHSVPVAREQLERLVRILDAHNYAKDAEALMALLAAAPGKEVPQAWLDVQAERRRQVEAEG
ncbi:hypothetical protein AO969_27365, partial [Pseudomonas aeruginosa]|uniref:hypothetical protein n=1 Tax=Pseudomonas aeruginosa TaxID=287 RepID=UPI00071B23A2